MIFTTILAAIWHYFDVLAYCGALVALCVGAWLISPAAFCFALAASLALLGLLSELVARVASKGGDD